MSPSPAGRAVPAPSVERTGRADWPVVGIVVVALAWAAAYVVATVTNPYDEPEAATLIRPLLIAAAALAPVVVWGATGRRAARFAPDEPEGLRSPARLTLLGSLAAFALLAYLGGFVVAIIVYLGVMLPLLGMRRPLVVTLVIAGFVAVAWGGFAGLLGVRLPLWPPFLT